MIVAALGYFVDIYDLVLFSIVRVASLKGIGVPASDLLETGVFLLNLQMTGMLVGGVLWGILGDKRGRVSVLFGSIFLYSIANILNAFVVSVPQYGILRFIAGVGLAGELGAAVTLVSEIMSKEHRGWGTTIVASVGICGAVVAALVGDAFSWKTAYVVGGCLGLVLLVLRVGIYESGMFSKMVMGNTKRGDFLMLFSHRERVIKYLSCIFIGIPIWFVIGILITFSPEIAKELAVTGPISAGSAIMYCYIGLAIGDLGSGLLSQVMRTRKKVVAGFLGLTGLFIFVYAFSREVSPAFFYAVCIGLGLATGYWAVFITIASEQFGTNIRATVTTTAPNFVRGSVVPVTLAFRALAETQSLIVSALIVGFSTLVVAFVALFLLRETFGKDLNYLEEA